MPAPPREGCGKIAACSPVLDANSGRKGRLRNFSLRRRPGVPDARFAWRGGDPRADAPGKPGAPSTRVFRVLGWKPAFGFLGRNAAKRAKKLQTTPHLFPTTITSHESLSSLTLGFVSRRSNSRRLSGQLTPRLDTRAGCHGSDNGHV